MRKLKLQVQISIDGFISGLNGEMDWITFDLGNDILKYISDLNKDIDCILLGRKLAEGFIPHWKTEATDPTKKRAFVERMSGQYDFAKKMHETSKVVFTKSLETNEWENTVLANGNLKEEITKLKKQNGKDLIVYGGGTLVSSLIKEELIDELHLFVNPTAIGNGMPIFKELDSKKNFDLRNATSFECGIVALHYEPKIFQDKVL